VTTVISQGSVATRLRCGGQCDSHFVANFLVNSTMEKFRNPSTSAKVMGKSMEVPFLTRSVYIYIISEFSSVHFIFVALWTSLGRRHNNCPSMH